MIEGKVWKFGDNIDTDQIIASQYLQIGDINEMKNYTFESLSPDFTKIFQAGDMIVAGKNFGCGSSREQAPLVLKALGLSAVIAVSFARIFFRNSINIGLPLIISEDLYQVVNEHDAASLLFDEGRIETNKQSFHFHKYPEHIQRIIDSGGLIPYINQ